MLEKISQLAERTATNASRREFLGRFGRGAMALAAVAAGLLAPSDAAEAASQKVCGTDSAGQCRGRVEGSLCGTRERPGRCVGAPTCKCQLRGR